MHRKQAERLVLKLMDERTEVGFNTLRNQLKNTTPRFLRAAQTRATPQDLARFLDHLADLRDVAIRISLPSVANILQIGVMTVQDVRDQEVKRMPPDAQRTLQKVITSASTVLEREMKQ